MTNLTLKTTTLLILAFFSTPGLTINNTPAAETGTFKSNKHVQTQQQGDVLKAQPSAVKVLDFPRRGMSTDKVQNELGRPSTIIPAVGQPPISRWVYDDRTVYFENSSVIHVVAK